MPGRQPPLCSATELSGACPHMVVPDPPPSHTHDAPPNGPTQMRHFKAMMREGRGHVPPRYKVPSDAFAPFVGAYQVWLCGAPRSSACSQEDGRD